MRSEADKFSGIFITVLTMPWSLMVAFTKDYIGLLYHYELNGFQINIIMFLIVIGYTALLYFTFRFLDSAEKK